MKSPLKITAFTGVLFLLSPAISSLLPASNPISSYDTEKERAARNASAFAQLLGQFRTSMADMIFVKTERYMDSGVGYEPHIEDNELGGGGHNHDHHDHDHGHDHDHEHDHDHGEVQTLIRTADNDFRHFIGALERKVKPWRDPNLPHEHTAGTELLPWYRLATLSDPHNVRNYMIGAWWLKSLRDEQHLEEALNFVNEGITNNPEAYDLYLMKGYIQRQSQNIDSAKLSFAKSAELALKRRPADGPGKTDDWDITDEEQMLAAMTMHTALVRDTESTATARTVISQYQKALPDEGALKRVRTDLE